MKIVCLLLFSFFTTFLFSQEKKQLTELKKRMQLKSNVHTRSPNFKAAQAFFFNEEWDSTLVYTAKQLSQSNLDKELENYCYLFRGHSFYKKKLYKESEKEFLKITPDFYFYPIMQMYLGEAALEQSKFEESREYFKKLDGIDMEGSFSVKRSVIDQNIGITYLHQKEFDKAEKYMLKSTASQEKDQDTLRLIGAYGNLANLYYVQYKDDIAIPYFKKAYNLSKYVDDFDVKRKHTKNMAVVEENRKDFAKALQYRKEFEQWKDSLSDQNKIYETAQLEKKIAVEQKEKEVQVLEAENKVKAAQNRVYLFSGVSAFALLIIVFISYRGTKKRNKIITAQKEDLDQLNATKDKLFSIVSHDLRSSVNAIKTSNKKLLSTIETQNKEELSQTLQQNSAIVNGAYGLLDNLLNWALLQTQQTYFEMADLNLYHITSHVVFNYQPILKEKNIEYINGIDKKILVFADQESLKIILRNLLDNAIKFSEDGGKIQVYSEEVDGTYVRFIVEDSGLGMDEETKHELLKDSQLLSKKKHEEMIGTGLGLHLVKSMIAKNQGKFHIESRLGKGTQMIISLLKSRKE